MTNKFNKLKRKSRKNKIYVPPKYQNLDWGWGWGGRLEGSKLSVIVSFFKNVFSLNLALSIGL